MEGRWIATHAFSQRGGKVGMQIIDYRQTITPTAHKNSAVAKQVCLRQPMPKPWADGMQQAGQRPTKQNAQYQPRHQFRFGGYARP